MQGGAGAVGKGRCSIIAILCSDLHSQPGGLLETDSKYHLHTTHLCR